jgi:Amt family ammonium transporter
LSALAIGALGAGASYVAVQWRSKTSIDDALDVFACHGVAGIVGALLTGVFATKGVNAAGANGLFYGNASLLGIQALAVAATILFVAPTTALVLAPLKAMGTLRVQLSEELSGVDVSEHGEHAYDDGEMSAFAGAGLTISEPIMIPTRGDKAAA